MRNKITKAITLGGIYSAIYAILTVLSIYVVPILSVLSLIIMPIFAAYYSSVFRLKDTIIFNISTILICFLIGLGDPLFTILYILPTLIVGDLFGLFSHLKLKYYTTMFLQVFTFSITNYLSLLFGELFLETSIIRFIISDQFVYDNFSLIILFTLSASEAVLSSLFIFEKLQLIGIYKEKEKEMPLYGYITIIGLLLLSIVFYFVSKNFYLLSIYIIAILGLIPCKDVIEKIKRKELFLCIYVITFISLAYILCLFEYYYLIGILLILPIEFISIVKLIIIIYNKSKN